MKTSYKDTLNLPKTDFPMKASLSIREKEQISFWKQNDIYHKRLIQNKNHQKFILHDGPPYANGHLHVGHALNKVIKDIIAKYYAKVGYYSPYILGWDCHGLPIEIQAQKKLKGSYNKNQLRDVCKLHAEEYIQIQAEEFERLMVFGDYKNRYATLDYSYESKILDVLKLAVEKDLIYRGNRPVHWCISCATALADAEIEYAQHESPSLFVSFPILGQGDTSFLVWTTTPWTLVANAALAFNSSIAYGIYRADNKKYILAKELVSSVSATTGIKLEWVEDISLDTIMAYKAQHPFLQRESQLITAEHVTLEAGTGIVHTAPAHGEEDFQAGLVYNLPVIMAINDYGKFISVPLVQDIDFILGDTIWKANPKILDKLKETGNLFFTTLFKHSYPHCWRCKNPVVTRATSQWFIRVSTLVPQMLESIEQDIQFFPPDRKTRMLTIVKDRPDWCISRQRSWGVPIPSIKCECGDETLNPEIIREVSVMVATKGANFWFSQEVSVIELFPQLQTQACNACSQTGKYVKGQDILDVWFDSAISWLDLMDNKLNLPVDTPIQVYSEGNDQFRAWYQVSLITGLIVKNKTPYERVLTHAMVLDEQGKAMSKSMGNVISPLDITNQYGADILRLWVVSQNYNEDMRIGKTILDQMADSYRKIRNTFRFLLSNLYDYTENDYKDFSAQNLTELDQWLLFRLDELQKKVHQAYQNFTFDVVYKEIFQFMNEYLSSFYLDVLKDPLYTLSPTSHTRRSAQYTMTITIQVLIDLLAPILCFTTEEVYKHLPFTLTKKEESLFLSNNYSLEGFEKYKKPFTRVEKILALRFKVLKELELLRQNKVIGSNLEAKVVIKTSQAELLDLTDLDFYFIVSEYEIQQSEQELEIQVSKGQYCKCPRCYRYVSQEEDKVCQRCEEVLNEKTSHSY